VRSRVPLLLLVGAPLAAGAWLALGPGSTPPDADAPPVDAAPSPRAEPPPRAAPGLAAPAPAGPVAAAPPPAPAARAEAPRLRGRVALPAGASGARVVAWEPVTQDPRTRVWRVPDAPPEVLEPDAGGEFSARAPEGKDLALALVVPGHAVLRRTARADGALDLAPPERSLRWRARVVDARSGEGVPDLDVHVHPAERFPVYGIDARDVDLRRTVPDGTLLATARTDATGRFEVLGLPEDAEVRVLPAAGTWFPRTSGQVRVSGPGEARVEVQPGFRVRTRVVADETGDPVAAFDARVTWTGSDLGFMAEDGGFDVVLRRDAREAFDVVVTAAVGGREPAKATARLGPADAGVSLDLRLRRLLPAAKAGVSFEILGGADGFAAQPFDLELREAEGGPMLRRMPTERVDPARVRATVPAGTWHLRLRAVDVSTGPPDWRGVLDLPEGRETNVRWDVR
jgi:hypothetical protein